MNRYAPMLLVLAAVWGASYLFIKVAVDEIAPAPMMAMRTLLAAAVLIAYVVSRFGWERTRAEARQAWRHFLVLGALNAAVPFWLIAWGEQHIDSGLAAVVQASVPIFNALIALKVLPQERLNGTRALGLGIGIVGVAVVTGIHPSGGWLAVAGALAVVLSSLSYASAGVYGQLAVSGTTGPMLAAGSMLMGGVILLPLALFQLPDAVPSWEATGSILALSLLGTALAQLILYRILASHGSARLSLVTYLMPGFALLYGATILDEKITAATIVGLALILGGVALASGAVRLPAGRDRPRPAMNVTLRPAAPDDLEFLTDLYADEAVRPFLATGGRYERDGIAEQLERDPQEGGLLVVELEGDRAGAMFWERTNIRSRIAHVSGIAIHPDFRGRRLADDAARLLQHHLIRERGFHRLELEIYGFNERAQRHAERSGYVREGVKRQAYRQGNGWVDGVLYAIVEEDLDAPR